MVHMQRSSAEIVDAANRVRGKLTYAELEAQKDELLGAAEEVLETWDHYYGRYDAETDERFEGLRFVINSIREGVP